MKGKSGRGPKQLLKQYWRDPELLSQRELELLRKPVKAGFFKKKTG